MLKTVLERDLGTGITTLRLVGFLTRTGRRPVRDAIGKAAAECPAAVIVDLSELHRPVEVPPSLFPMTTYLAQEEWGVPVLLCGAEPDFGSGLGAYRSFVALYEQ